MALPLSDLKLEVKNILIEEGVPDTDVGFIEKLSDEMISIPGFEGLIENERKSAQKLVHEFLKSEIRLQLDRESASPVELITLAEMVKRESWVQELSLDIRKKIDSIARSRLLTTFKLNPEVLNGQSIKVLYQYLPSYPLGEKISPEVWEHYYRFKNENETVTMVLWEYLELFLSQVESNSEILKFLVINNCFSLSTNSSFEKVESLNFIEKLYRNIAKYAPKLEGDFKKLIPILDLDHRVLAHKGLRSSEANFSILNFKNLLTPFAKDYHDLLLRQLSTIGPETKSWNLLSPENMLWLLKVDPRGVVPLLSDYVKYRFIRYDLMGFNGVVNAELIGVLNYILNSNQIAAKAQLFKFVAEASFQHTKLSTVQEHIEPFLIPDSVAWARIDFMKNHGDASLKKYLASLLDDDVPLYSYLAQEPALVNRLLAVGVEKLYPEKETLSKVVRALLRAQGDFLNEPTELSLDRFKLMKLFEDAIKWGLSSRTNTEALFLARAIADHIELYRQMASLNYNSIFQFVSREEIRTQKARILEKQLEDWSKFLESRVLKFQEDDAKKLGSQFEEARKLVNLTLGKPANCNEIYHGVDQKIMSN